MDALLLHEMCEANPDWEISVLADNRGIFIGSYFDLKVLMAHTDIEEE